MILALDEMSLYFQATLTRVWSPVGQTPVVHVTPQRDHIHYYGALNVRTGHEIALPVPHQSSEMTAHFLQHVLACYPTQPILLLWDRAPWHKGQAVRQLLTDTPRLYTWHFPPASPDLNPQEHVWSQARDAISHNHTQTNFGCLTSAFLDYLSGTRFRFDWLETYAPTLLCHF